MKFVYLRDVMKNQEVAEIMDWWHLMADYELYLNEKHLYRLDLQQPNEDMIYFSTLTLARYWIETLEERQLVHKDEETIQCERKQIEVLKAFVAQEEAQPMEFY